MTPRWTIHRLSRTLGDHATAWDALNQRLFNSHPMLDSRFVNGLLRHFGDGSEQLCALQQGGTVQAMCILRPGALGVWSTFLPMQAQIGPTLAERPESIKTLLSQLPGYATRLDMLCNDPNYGDLSALATQAEDGMHHAQTMAIKLEGSFDHYWETRPRSLSQNLRRYDRFLVRDNITCNLVCISHPDAMGAAISRYAGLESLGWKGALGTALEVGNKQTDFYSELLSRYAASNGAIVFELWFGDRLAASRMVIASTDMVVMLKTTYDENFKQYSPGRLLLRETIRALFATHPDKTIEFYTDANIDQLAWSTGHRYINHVSLYRSTFARNTLLALQTLSGVLMPKGIDDAGTASALGVSVYRHPDQLPTDALRLMEYSKRQSIELGPSWYRNLVNTVYPNDSGVCFYVLRRDGKPVVVLPLRITKGFFGQRAMSLSNYYTSLYSPTMEDGVKVGELAYLVHAVKRAQAPLAELRLAPMDPDSNAYGLWYRGLIAGGMMPFKFFAFGNWYLKVTGDWPAYLKDRPGALRSTIKRMTKKFVGDGGTIELFTGAEHSEKAVAAFQAVYAKSWKHAEPFPEFVPSLIRMCAERGWLRLGVAWLDGKPIAAQLWITANRKTSIFKMAYDEDFKPYAPGTLVTAMLMERAMQTDKVLEVDYLIGDDPYKETWMSHRRERWGLIAYNPGGVLGLVGLVREAAGRYWKYRKQSK